MCPLLSQRIRSTTRGSAWSRPCGSRTPASLLIPPSKQTPPGKDGLPERVRRDPGARQASGEHSPTAHGVLLLPDADPPP
eukprot:8031086-Alexandrium_andersonii.AAC.1